MKNTKPIDAKRISEVLRYEPETGHFFWLVNHHKMRIGKKAGYKRQNGYVCIKVDGEHYQAARLAMALSYGGISELLEVDHINRDQSDDRLENLRIVSSSENCKNRRTKTGLQSPRFYTKLKTGKFQAIVRGKYLGVFETEELAQAAVKGELK